MPLVTFSCSSAVLSHFVMPTEPLKLVHDVYINRDYFALNKASGSCCTAVFQLVNGTALSFRTPAEEWWFFSR